MDNTHTEHNQQSTEDIKHTEKKPQTCLHNCKMNTGYTHCKRYVQPNNKIQNYRSTQQVHRALCSLFQPDTDGARVSKCGQLSQQTRGLDPILFQCWSSAVGVGPILKQHWVKSSRLLGSTQVSSTPTPPPP